jgi:ABC-2 type transport system ATP-binding protein
LTVENPEDASRAAGIVERVLGEKAQRAATEISAPLRCNKKLTAALTALEDGQIVLSAINLQQPTLDEVFLALTGGHHKNTEEVA